MTNGLTERFHDFLNKQLSKVVSTDQQDWEDYLPGILLAYRVSVHEGTKHSPFFLHTGRDPVLPGDLLFGPKEKYYGDDYVPMALQRLHKSFALAKQERIHTRAVNKAYYDRKATTRTFQPGDAVYYFHPGPQVKGTSRKWKRKWQPFFRVMEKKSDVNYVIQHQPTGLTKLVHMNNLQAADPDTVWENYYEGYGRFTEPSNMKKTGTGKCPFETGEGQMPRANDGSTIRQQPIRQAKLVVGDSTDIPTDQPYVWPTLSEWSRPRNHRLKTGQDQEMTMGDNPQGENNSDQVPRKRKSVSISKPEEDDIPVKMIKPDKSHDMLNLDEQRNQDGRVLRSAVRRLPPQSNTQNDHSMESQDVTSKNRKRVTLDMSESEPPKRPKIHETTGPPNTTLCQATPTQLGAGAPSGVNIDGIQWDLNEDEEADSEYGDVWVSNDDHYDILDAAQNEGWLEKQTTFNNNWPSLEQPEPCIFMTQTGTDTDTKGLSLESGRCFEGRDALNKVARFWYMLSKSMKAGKFE
jgi:hypothetical protein